MNTTTATVPDLGTRELVLSRILAAPRERVFRTWTTRLSEWWGPHGMTTAVREMDLRPGGAFHTIMRAPDGAEFPTRGVFLEVVAPERIVFTDAFDAGWRPHPAIFFTAVVTFGALARDRTEYVVRARHWTETARERHERMGFRQGWGESIERLAACVSRA